MKITSLFTCSQCSYQASKWLGKCPQCEAWNSFAEEEIRKETAGRKKIQAHARTPHEYGALLNSLRSEKRNVTGISELDRVLGGGLVSGSLLLLTGEPGIGKSTLTLELANAFGNQGMRVLYCSGEESESQVAIRGKRLGLPFKNLKLISEMNLETLLATAETEKTEFLIVDSIQVMSSQGIPGGPGSVSQVRLCTEQILEFAKPKGITVLLTGHVTKDGTLAGPRVLEHLVDCVLYLEGSRSGTARMLRSVKNRFGGVHEVGIFEMTEKGLQEVKNPASYFIQNRGEPVAGSVLVLTTEGSRPIVLEVQALTNQTAFGYPVRRASGFDANRLALLLAVLQKHLHVNLGNQDVYVNVVSGFELDDPAADLGVCLAVLSSYYKKPLPAGLVAIGEVGLNAEVRPPKEFARFKKEIQKLGLVLMENSQSLPAIAKQYFR